MPLINPTKPLIENGQTKFLTKSLNIAQEIDKFCATVSDKIYNEDENSGKPEENKQIKNFIHISDKTVPPHAIAVLPTALQVLRNAISPKRLLPNRVRFGPVQGIKHNVTNKYANKLVSEAAASKSPIFLLKKNNGIVTYLDVSDKDKSNWLSLLPLGDNATANVWIYEDDDELYGITVKSIAPRTPLIIGYSKEYAEEHLLPEGQPILDLTENLSIDPRQWWCYECQRTISSASLLQRHMDVYHKAEKPPSRRRYRCQHCTRTFSRLFTLKRHMARYCFKKTEQKDQFFSKELPESILNMTHSIEDNRIPSDESFQNFTSNLDFSTSLFDTDRIPNLDISGSSRSENEFNPHSVGCKDDNVLTNNLEFAKLSNDTDNAYVNHGENTEQSYETFLIPCPHCSEIIARGKLRQHVKSCPGRRFECECGQIFSKKDKLAQHIFSNHPPDATPKPETKELCELPYKCENCQYAFKRRGMLINHLWRVHKIKSAAIPLERLVRHYPCVACPKIYRAAAKRDRHVRKHHPGAEIMRAQSIEGGRRVCEPAACSACPRQYVTRAKLLQHVRAHHPHLAPPVKKKISKSKSNENQQISKSKTTLQQNLGFLVDIM